MEAHATDCKKAQWPPSETISRIAIRDLAKRPRTIHSVRHQALQVKRRVILPILTCEHGTATAYAGIMIEALLYIFANNEGALREQVARAENAAQPRTITEADTAAGGRIEIAICAPLKFHQFNDAVFVECRTTFLPGPFSTLSSNTMPRA